MTKHFVVANNDFEGACELFDSLDKHFERANELLQGAGKHVTVANGFLGEANTPFDEACRLLLGAS